MKLIDLTYTLSDNVPTFAGCRFHLNVIHDYKDSNDSVAFRVQAIRLDAGTGTHLDAPAHIQQGKLFIDEIPLSQLCAPLIMIDVSHKANENYLIAKNDVLEFERQHGAIPEQSEVFKSVSGDLKIKNLIYWAHINEYGGGPGKQATKSALQHATSRLNKEVLWLKSIESQWLTADHKLQTMIAQILKSQE